MFLFEILGELRAPGPVGTVEIGADPPLRSVSPFYAVFNLGLTIAAFMACTLGAAMYTEPASLLAGVGGGTAFLIDLVIAFFVKPKAETSNMGWPFALMNDPLRYSDDLNRGLSLLSWLLFPGRILAWGVRDLFLLLAGELEAA